MNKQEEIVYDIRVSKKMDNKGKDIEYKEKAKEVLGK